MRVPAQRDLLEWACHRRGLQPVDLTKKFPKILSWLDGTVQPTLKQLEAFARHTYTPIGYLFLTTPPVEEVPIPDMRTIGSIDVGAPSPNLLDTLYLCQQRQDWYRQYAQASGETPLAFVGSLGAQAAHVPTAAAIRDVLAFDIDTQMNLKTWSKASQMFVECADDAGILVMTSGIVGTNTHRKLDPNEFRGFALSDVLAPLVFVNGADTKAAQMFTLAHELAHLWRGQSALSDTSPETPQGTELEQWCNAVAAELLVPFERLQVEVRQGQPPLDEARRLARLFKVSTLVLLRRLHEIGRLSRTEMWALYQAELSLILSKKRSSPGGGSFYPTQRVRLGRRFARAVIESTWEGRSSFSEAFRLLNVKKTATLIKLGVEVGSVI